MQQAFDQFLCSCHTFSLIFATLHAATWCGCGRVCCYPPRLILSPWVGILTSSLTLICSTLAWDRALVKKKTWVWTGASDWFWVDVNRIGVTVGMCEWYASEYRWVGDMSMTMSGCRYLWMNNILFETALRPCRPLYEWKRLRTRVSVGERNKWVSTYWTVPRLSSSTVQWNLRVLSCSVKKTSELYASDCPMHNAD